MFVFQLCGIKAPASSERITAINLIDIGKTLKADFSRVTFESDKQVGQQFVSPYQDQGGICKASIP